VEYQLNYRKGDDGLAVTVWLDAKTGLPLKRQVSAKADGGTRVVEELYTDLKVGGKLDARTFELPKE
jgi:hypothetical protein